MTSSVESENGNEQPRASNASIELKTIKDKMGTLTASEFVDFWRRYDIDGNGFIEEEELESFIKDSFTPGGTTRNKIIPANVLRDLQKSLMKTDKNGDGKIDIRELANLLPIEQNFLLLFRFDNELESSVDFMRVWRAFDADGTGCIEADELKNFLRHLIDRKSNDKSRRDAPLTDQKLDEYAKMILKLYDTNKDGKLQLSEMARLLPFHRNILSDKLSQTDGFSTTATLKRHDIERIFKQYDKNGDKTLATAEVDGLCNDMLNAIQGEHTKQDLDLFRQALMAGCDTNRDGKINVKDFKLILQTLATFQECKAELRRRGFKQRRSIKRKGQVPKVTNQPFREKM